MTRQFRSLALAVSLGLGAMLATLSPPVASAEQGTWRCTGADGKVLFTNGNCPAGTAKASAWVPTPADNRIERSAAKQDAPLAAGQQPLDPLLPTGRVDPFVDCKARGGDFDLAARVCRLPPGGTQPWTATSN